jgi:hypothetical protein
VSARDLPRSTGASAATSAPTLSVSAEADAWRVRVESRSAEFDEQGRLALLVSLRVDDADATLGGLGYPGASFEWRVPRGARRVRVEVPGLGLVAELAPPTALDPRRAPWVASGAPDRAALRPEAVQRALAQQAARAATAKVANGAAPARVANAAVTPAPTRAALAERPAAPRTAPRSPSAPASPPPRGPRGRGGAR